MEKEAKKFFKDLVEVSSPSGFEEAAQKVFRDFVAPYADEIKTDLHGNVIALKKGEGHLRFMVAGHADELGLLISYIDENGYLSFKTVGGIDPVILSGQKVLIHHEGKTIKGVVGRKPIHLLTADERAKVPTFDSMWIDIGAKDKKDAEKKVSLGDYVTYLPGMETLNGEIITTKATDNKAGVCVAGLVLKELAGKKVKANVYAVSTVQEEIGIRGAKTSSFTVDPHVAIAVDVTFASDFPGAEKKKLGEIALGKGPVIAVGPNINPKVSKLLKEAAAAAKIEFQLEIEAGATGTDANAMQLSKGGVATGLIGIPNRYMHTPVEIISLKDVENAAKLIAQFICMLDSEELFIPSL